MIIFSTKLYVKESLTNELFVNMTLNWAENSPNYSFANLSWNKKDEYYVESSDKLQTLNIIKYNDSIMVHLTNKDSNNILWTNDYVLTTRGDKRVLSVQLYRDAENISTKLQNEFNRPRLLKTIIRDGYGAFDNDLEISDRCLMITEANIDIIKKVIIGEEEYMMPIVHITPQFKNSNFIINHNELAKDLAGVAHVLVDKDYSITNHLKELTSGQNPYNGGVQIYFCKGVSTRILPINIENVFRKQVANAVFRKLILSKIDDDLSWSKLRIKKINENREQNEKDNIELQKLYEEEIKNKDNEIAYLTEHIQSLETENTAYLIKIKSLEQHLDNSKSADEYTTGIVLASQEYDFFEDEQKNTVLAVLEKEFESMKSTPNQKETRKFHILNSILQQNSIIDVSNEIKKQFRSIFADNAKLNATMKKSIIHLGFTIDEGKHYKLKYNGDDRYIFTMSKTPGDGRAMKNLRTQILRVLFNTTD